MGKKYKNVGILNNLAEINRNPEVFTPTENSDDSYISSSGF
jgi:hypothetical protein